MGTEKKEAGRLAKPAAQSSVKKGSHLETGPELIRAGWRGCLFFNHINQPKTLTRSKVLIKGEFLCVEKENCWSLICCKASGTFFIQSEPEKWEKVNTGTDDTNRGQFAFSSYFFHRFAYFFCCWVPKVYFSSATKMLICCQQCL